MVEAQFDTRRYLIAGKDAKAGVVGADSSNLNEYFELGWEVTTTYLQAVHGRQTGRFTGSEVVVTASGREFLYRSSFTEVISYAEFCRRRVDPSGVVDLVTRTNLEYFSSKWLRRLRLRVPHRWLYHLWHYRIRYRRLGRRLPMQRPCLEAFPTVDEFLCIAVRFRDHQPQRNLPREYWHELLDALEGTACFLVGHGAEDLVRHPRHQVCSLAEFAALVQHPNCRGVLASMTGPTQLAQMLHRRRLAVIDLDDHYRQLSQQMPCVLSDVCNFPRVRHSVYNYRPSVRQLLRDLSVPSPASRITPASYRRDRRFFDADVRKGHAFFEYDEGAGADG